MLDGLDEIVSLVWALAVICGVLALSYWFTRYVAGRASAGRPRGRQIQLLEEIPVGKDQKLLLVRVGETIQLLGASPGGITCLRTLTPQEAEAWSAPDGRQPEDGRLSFSEALHRVLQQRKK